MKKALFLLALAALGYGADAQEIRDAKNNVQHYIDIHTTSLLNKERQTVAIFRQDGRIVDTKSNTLGYIAEGHVIQDKNRKPVGTFSGNGQLEDANNNVVGYMSMTGSGPVMDAHHKVIGNTDRVEPMWAAAYYLLLNKM